MQVSEDFGREIQDRRDMQELIMRQLWIAQHPLDFEAIGFLHTIVNGRE
jgi:hypothetical protein